MAEQQSSYRQIMKATSLFGGVQVINILIAIIRSKIIAVLLGPAGMGIAGLLTSTTGLISGLTNFGLGTSAVKNVASANATGNQIRISTVVTVMRRLVWITGLIGSVITIIFSPLLSRLTFGNVNYTIPFIYLSISLLFAQLSSGQMILLQGMRKLQYLAKANLIGSAMGLFTTVPLYYWLGINGIVPAIIVSSIITLVGSWYFARKIKINAISVSKVRTFAEGKEMLKMGFMISLSGLIMMGASYIVRIFISNHGGVEQVGLYNAGFSILNSYVGLIFVAMGTDYYPRISAVAHSNEECSKVINQQAEIAILVMAPIIILVIVFNHWLIALLYSSMFTSVNEMILWASLGMLFKAFSWAIAYIFLAKGSSRLFFWNELFFNGYMLAGNILGYYFFGLAGIGASFLIGYLIYLVQVFIIATLKFELKIYRELYIILLVQLIIAMLSFLPATFIGGSLTYIIGGILFLASSSYSLNKLNSRMGLLVTINSLINKYKK